MKEVKAGTILENAARVAGRDINLIGMPPNWPPLAAMAINAGMIRLASEKFPMMTRVELRRYRPEWVDGQSYGRSNEVFWKGDYWRMVDTSAAGEPGVANGWKKLEDNEINPFVAWDQPWENTVMDRAGVDVGRFAYVADPKYNPNATPINIIGMNSFGVQLEAPAPKEVWCKFVPEYPTIRFDPWTSGMSYSAGTVCYVSDEKECYVALKDIKGDDAEKNPEEGKLWTAVRIPGEFESYLVRLAAAELLTQDQGKQQSLGYAEQEFARICEFYHEGNGETRVRRGRFI